MSVDLTGLGAAVGQVVRNTEALVFAGGPPLRELTQEARLWSHFQLIEERCKADVITDCDTKPDAHGENELQLDPSTAGREGVVGEDSEPGGSDSVCFLGEMKLEVWLLKPPRKPRAG